MRRTVLLIVLALPSVATADVWDEAYNRGLNAIKAGNYAVAVDELQRAIADDPNEFISEEQPRNGWTAYLPHYWLGIAKFNLGDFDGALRAWKISEQQGVVLQSSYYAQQLREWVARANAQQKTRARPMPVQSAPQPMPVQSAPQPRPVPPPTATTEPTTTTSAESSSSTPTEQPVITTSTAPSSFPADQQLEWDANIAFNTPDQINLGEHQVIKLLLDLRRPAKELERELHEAGKTATATIKISDTVEARLSGAAFDIRPITPELQSVSADETTEWLWEVTPKQEGQHRLFLTVNNIQRKRSIRTFDRIIEVRVPPRSTDKWIVPIAVLAGVVLLLSLLLFILRRRTPPPADDTVRVGETNQTTLAVPTVPLSASSMTFRPGQVIDERYRIVRLVGQGGMGAVYAAEDREFEGELVALKTILAPDHADKLLARFKKEIQLARRVAHPNVCRIFDVGYHVTGPGESTVFVSMEYITGVPLKTFIQQKGRLNEGEALAIIRDVAAALDATHAAGLIHRDIKSGNVMLSDKGNRAVLMDFGLACLSNPSEGDRSLTKTGAIIGTPAYMSPEQIEGAPLTAATDIYAFGMVIYEMVTGRLPYEGDTPVSILAKRLREQPRSPAHFVPNLKKEWEQAILTCLEHDPAKRFRLAMDVYRALDRAADAPTLVL